MDARKPSHLANVPDSSRHLTSKLFSVKQEDHPYLHYLSLRVTCFYKSEYAKGIVSGPTQMRKEKDAVAANTRNTA